MEGNGLPIVIVTVGIPGSGKSTWTKEFNAIARYTNINPDSIRMQLTGSISDQSKNGDVWKLAYELLNTHIEMRSNVIFDSTACNMKTIEEIKQHCKDKAIVCFKIFDVDTSTCIERIKKDITEGKARSNVPDKVVYDMHERFIPIKEYLLKNENVIKD